MLFIFSIILRIHHRIWGLWLLQLGVPKLVVSSSFCLLLALDQVCINFCMMYLLKQWRLTRLIVDNGMFLLLSNEILQDLRSTIEKTPRYNNLVRLKNLEMTWRVQQALLLAEIRNGCVQLLQALLRIFFCELPRRWCLSLLYTSREFSLWLFPFNAFLMILEKVHNFEFFSKLFFSIKGLAFAKLLLHSSIAFNQRTFSCRLKDCPRCRSVTNIAFYVIFSWPIIDEVIVSKIINLIITHDCSSR